MEFLEEIEKGKEDITDSLPFPTDFQYLRSSRSPPLGGLAFVLEAVSLSELLYASCCVDEFLLSGKERVTVGTDINMDVADCRSGFR